MSFLDLFVDQLNETSPKWWLSSKPAVSSGQVVAMVSSQLFFLPSSSSYSVLFFISIPIKEGGGRKGPACPACPAGPAGPGNQNEHELIDWPNRVDDKVTWRL